MKSKRVLFIAPPRTFVFPDIPCDYYYHRINPFVPALILFEVLKDAGWECPFFFFVVLFFSYFQGYFSSFFS